MPNDQLKPFLIECFETKRLTPRDKSVYLTCDVTEAPRIHEDSSAVVLHPATAAQLTPVACKQTSEWPALHKSAFKYLRKKIGEKDVTLTLASRPRRDSRAISDGFTCTIPEETKVKLTLSFLLDILDGTLQDGAFRINENKSGRPTEEKTDDAMGWILWPSEAFVSLEYYENVRCVFVKNKRFVVLPPSSLPHTGNTTLETDACVGVERVTNFSGNGVTGNCTDLCKNSISEFAELSPSLQHHLPDIHGVVIISRHHEQSQLSIHDWPTLITDYPLTCSSDTGTVSVNRMYPSNPIDYWPSHGVVTDEVSRSDCNGGIEKDPVHPVQLCEYEHSDSLFVSSYVPGNKSLLESALTANLDSEPECILPDTSFTPPNITQDSTPSGSIVSDMPHSCDTACPDSSHSEDMLYVDNVQSHCVSLKEEPVSNDATPHVSFDPQDMVLEDRSNNIAVSTDMSIDISLQNSAIDIHSQSSPIFTHPKGCVELDITKSKQKTEEGKAKNFSLWKRQLEGNEDVLDATADYLERLQYEMKEYMRDLGVDDGQLGAPSQDKMMQCKPGLPQYVSLKPKKKRMAVKIKPGHWTSAFLRFCAEQRQAMLESYPDVDNENVSQFLRKKWNAMRQEEKEPYLLKFYEELKQMRGEHPEWDKLGNEALSFTRSQPRKQKAQTGKKNARRGVKMQPHQAFPRMQKQRIQEPEWLQCAKCLKWRKLPVGVDSDDFPLKWNCSLNPDIEHNTCNAEEDLAYRRRHKLIGSNELAKDSKPTTINQGNRPISAGQSECQKTLKISNTQGKTNDVFGKLKPSESMLDKDVNHMPTDMKANTDEVVQTLALKDKQMTPASLKRACDFNQSQEPAKEKLLPGEETPMPSKKKKPSFGEKFMKAYAKHTKILKETRLLGKSSTKESNVQLSARTSKGVISELGNSDTSNTYAKSNLLIVNSSNVPDKINVRIVNGQIVSDTEDKSPNPNAVCKDVCDRPDQKMFEILEVQGDSVDMSELNQWRHKLERGIGIMHATLKKSTHRYKNVFKQPKITKKVKRKNTSLKNKKMLKVQCSKCHKWRQIPAAIYMQISESWTCCVLPKPENTSPISHSVTNLAKKTSQVNTLQERVTKKLKGPKDSASQSQQTIARPKKLYNNVVRGDENIESSVTTNVLDEVHNSQEHSSVIKQNPNVTCLPENAQQNNVDGSITNKQCEQKLVLEEIRPFKRKRQRRKKNGLKRPLNAFIQFSNEFREIVSETNPNRNNREISMLLGRMWRKMTPEEKEPYIIVFKQQLDKIRCEHPDWNYSGRRQSFEGLGEVKNERLRTRKLEPTFTYRDLVQRRYQRHKAKQKDETRSIEENQEDTQQEESWAQCDDCNKWRKLPPTVDSRSLPQKWICSLNPDLKHNYCDAEEEVVEDLWNYHVITNSDDDSTDCINAEHANTRRTSAAKSTDGSACGEELLQVSVDQRDGVSSTICDTVRPNGSSKYRYLLSIVDKWKKRVRDKKSRGKCNKLQNEMIEGNMDCDVVSVHKCDEFSLIGTSVEQTEAEANAELLKCLDIRIKQNRKKQKMLENKLRGKTSHAVMDMGNVKVSRKDKQTCDNIVSPDDLICHELIPDSFDVDSLIESSLTEQKEDSNESTHIVLKTADFREVIHCAMQNKKKQEKDINIEKSVSPKTVISGKPQLVGLELNKASSQILCAKLKQQLCSIKIDSILSANSVDDVKLVNRQEPQAEASLDIKIEASRSENRSTSDTIRLPSNCEHQPVNLFKKFAGGFSQSHAPAIKSHENSNVLMSHNSYLMSETEIKQEPGDSVSIDQPVNDLPREEIAVTPEKADSDDIDAKILHKKLNHRKALDNLSPQVNGSLRFNLLLKRFYEERGRWKCAKCKKYVKVPHSVIVQHLSDDWVCYSCDASVEFGKCLSVAPCNEGQNTELKENSTDNNLIADLATSTTVPPLCKFVMNEDKNLDGFASHIDSGMLHKSNDKAGLKRPMNAFLKFSKEYREMVSECFPNSNNRNISKLLGRLWGQLIPEEKEPYLLAFREDLDKLRTVHPDWNYAGEDRRHKLDLGGVTEKKLRTRKLEQFLNYRDYFRRHYTKKKVWNKNKSLLDSDDILAENEEGGLYDFERQLQGKDDVWVQCDECNKWRKLISWTESENLPEKWTCSMNPNPKCNFCDAEEEEY